MHLGPLGLGRGSGKAAERITGRARIALPKTCFRISNDCDILWHVTRTSHCFGIMFRLTADMFHDLCILFWPYKDFGSPSLALDMIASLFGITSLKGKFATCVWTIPVYSKEFRSTLRRKTSKSIIAIPLLSVGAKVQQTPKVQSPSEVLQGLIRPCEYRSSIQKSYFSFHKETTCEANL